MVRPSPTAVNFFRRHASYTRRIGESVARAKSRIATALARAEAQAFAHGWRAEWEGDPDAECGVVLRDMDGHVMASRWELPRLRREKRRVVEAELALEALGDRR